MKKIMYCLAAIVTICTLVTGCKTTEENYRRAYERTMARDSARAELGETIYGRYRSQTRPGSITVNGDTIATQIIRVAITPKTGGIKEYIKRYCIVAAEFKQLFNATSMQERLQNGGWPGAFIVQNPEPYYYVIAASTDDADRAAVLLDSLKTTSPVRMRAPAPYILQPTQTL